ncbi:MAG: rhomboid family intramembrane serine protease [candidate division KSB1 bacterium]|nr:rhomboid family intramembrane serine protease [candidate division KSB1 bacterium]MDQ7063166.1 rhomboid family intramembrane serine protease [candidate division KSB1 bacterium]
MIPLRDENPRTGWPVVNFAFIAINILVFIYQLGLPAPLEHEFVLKYGAVPASILQGANWHTLITSMFLHGGFAHIIFNMLYLYIFGDNVENSMGSLRYIVFYLSAGLFAALAHMIMNPMSTVPMVGASGAISGIMGAYMVQYPRARVLVLVPIFFFITTLRVPALFLLAFWFITQLSSGLATIGMGMGGGIAWFAHIGGFIYGAATVKLFAKRKRIYIDDFEDF